MFDRCISGLPGGFEFKGISFSLYRSDLDKDPKDDCRQDVGRFLRTCFWYILPGDAAIVELLRPASLDHQEKTLFVTTFLWEQSYFFHFADAPKVCLHLTQNMLNNQFIDMCPTTEQT